MLSFAITIPVVPVITINKWKQRHLQRLRQRVSASIHHDSLRVLEWDKLCDVVASFATTSLGRQALKDQLWSLNQTFEESLALLEETNAAVEMHRHGTLRLHLGHLDAMLILEFVINRSLIKVIEQVVDEDGSIKDSAIGSTIEPLSVVPLNDELQRARSSVEKAEADVLLTLTKKMQLDVEDIEKILNSLVQLDVDGTDNALPVAVDFLVSKKTRVIVITGPNTGGKTICLKTVGLAAMMAKSGLYVLASESAKIPWFDSVFADIGDEQSLSQSLSTFSGHLKQISVGAGTNPLEGAALGMSLLESFAHDSCLLTMATTHHGELKTLKYSDEAFENACMEFDEVNLKPTYKILWGVPGKHSLTHA
ncbi:hypothetical protein LR48_Vigan07g181600 [Vigna angularis]|uniref:DNA mismatch repair proteins mutS family domain-containing protein n=1 Tax=Phaseolus angularis TaxID=3914 RepID=A0A0L9UZV2_PHAAN|nr:hypothetical protein LR48_Vigan07g181600 [Vigna angularis]